MAKLKTTFTGASVADYLATRASPEQRADCKVLMRMLRELTGERPRMWGPSIVGYGVYRYTYPSGHSGEAPMTGFAIRGRDIVVYLDCEGKTERKLLRDVGKYSVGKSCFYFRRLADLDQAVFRELVATSIAGVRQRYG